MEIREEIARVIDPRNWHAYDMTRGGNPADDPGPPIESLVTADQILALVYPKGWRPIEEAPRDFTPILGYNGRITQWYRWVNARPHSDEKAGWFNSEQGRVGNDDQPVFWMPVPHYAPLPVAPNPTLEGGDDE